jgi:CheY-like chemotaxis protein
VVDDDELSAAAVSDALERAGHDVVTVSSGADALAFLARARGSYVILLDLHMDDMNGWDVMSALPELRKRIIVMTGSTGEGVPRGVPVLRKPLRSETLLAAVDTLRDRASSATN